MKILLTNDDGYQSEKLQFTRHVLQQFGEVITVAPREEQSAKSMSLTIGGVPIKKIDSKTFIVEGTPVDCINYAIVGLGIKPDLVVSGTNDGYNIGIDTKYSGTVGAAIQAQYFGFQSLALSSDRKGMETVKRELESTMQYIFNEQLLSKDYTLNVNFSPEHFYTTKGIILTELDYRVYSYQPTTINGHFHPHRGYIDSLNDVNTNTDIWAYQNGYTSITQIPL